MTDIRTGHTVFKQIENHGLSQLEFILTRVQMVIDAQEDVVKNATPNDAVKHERPLLVKLQKEKQKVVDAIVKLGKYEIGSRISHTKYGKGWVQNVGTTPNNKTVYLVNFDKRFQTSEAFEHSVLIPEPKMHNSTLRDPGETYEPDDALNPNINNNTPVKV